ncbi:hypothetical protein [Arthrobacter pigmenti]
MLRILELLPTEPVLTVESLAAKHGVSSAADPRALVELGEAGF